YHVVHRAREPLGRQLDLEDDRALRGGGGRDVHRTKYRLGRRGPRKAQRPDSTEVADVPPGGPVPRTVGTSGSLVRDRRPAYAGVDAHLEDRSTAREGPSTRPARPP